MENRKDTEKALGILSSFEQVDGVIGISKKRIAFFAFFALILMAIIGLEASVPPVEGEGNGIILIVEPNSGVVDSSYTDTEDWAKLESDNDPLIEDLYAIPTDVWLKVLGDKGHYHFGQINPLDPSEDIFEHAVRFLYQFIPDHSAVLDCGCGWGGPAKLLAIEKGCKVTGVTTSFLQYEFIRDHVKEIEVVYKDLHKYIPQKKFDCALFFESATHLPNPRQIFLNLFPQVDAILLSDFIATDETFYNPRWSMYFRTKEEIIGMLRDSGYELEHYEEIVTTEEIRKSAQYWLDNLAKLNEEEIVGQLAALKNSSLRWSECSDCRRPWSIGVFYAKKNVQLP